MTQINLLRQVKNLNFPEGFLTNGQIVTSVNSGNLTVALKTLAGTDPSITNPVHCRIGGVVRSITSALSITLNAGTNYFNAGSSELATKEIDYFTYLWYNTTAGAVRIGFSRIANGRVSSDFSASPTNEKYYNTNDASISATDVWVNIGRFNAILSAGAGYTWSIPATSVIENRPIYETRWLEWLPTYSAEGSMTWTSVSTNFAKYKIEGSTLFIKIGALGTTGGTPNIIIKASGPFTIPDDCSGTIRVNDGSHYAGMFWGNSGILNFLRNDIGNFGLGINRGPIGQLFTNF